MDYLQSIISRVLNGPGGGDLAPPLRPRSAYEDTWAGETGSRDSNTHAKSYEQWNSIDAPPIGGRLDPEQLDEAVPQAQPKVDLGPEPTQPPALTAPKRTTNPTPTFNRESIEGDATGEPPLEMRITGALREPPTNARTSDTPLRVAPSSSSSPSGGVIDEPAVATVPRIALQRTAGRPGEVVRRSTTKPARQVGVSAEEPMTADEISTEPATSRHSGVNTNPLMPVAQGPFPMPAAPRGIEARNRQAALTGTSPPIAEPVVHISIGRVEVRANVHGQRERGHDRGQRQNGSGLAGYLSGAAPGGLP
jgi:hypothetical protein